MTKFAILSIQRSGSNFLRSCLNSHPDIKCFDEVFLHDAEFPESYVMAREEDPRLGIHITQYLNELYASNSKYKAVGIDIKYNCLNHQIIKALYDLDVSVIHLIRKNTTRIAISQAIGKDNEAPIVYEPEKLFKAIEYIDKMKEFYSSTASRFRNMTVYYEDITSREQDVRIIDKGESKRILRFLEVGDEITLRTDMKKKNPYEFKDLLVNYEEIKNESLRYKHR